MDVKIQGKPLHQWTRADISAYVSGLDRKTRLRFLALGVGLFVFIPFVGWPAWVLRPLKQMQMKELSEKMVSAKIQIQQEPKMRAEQIAYETLVKETGARLFTEKEAEGLLGILADKAQKSKVVLLSSQPQSASHQEIPPPFDKKYQTFSYLLVLEGGFHSLASFVSEVESFPKVIRVDDFSVSPREETPAVLSGELKISVFQRREGS